MILFDFDGVLADSLAICLEACQVAAKAQGHYSVFGPDAFADLDPLTFEAFAERAGLKPEAFVADVARHVQAADAPSSPFEGITDMIQVIAKEHSLGVVSASHGLVVSGFLGAHGIRGAFDHIAGGDTPGDKTTKIKGLIGDAAVDRQLFVGDAVSDIQSARAAGVPCCAVSWGWQPVERLRLQEPDHVVETPRDISRIARQYARKS